MNDPHFPARYTGETQPPRDQLPASTGRTTLAFPRPAAAAGLVGELNVAQLWSILAKWRLLIAGTTIAALIAAIAVTMLMHKLYQATVTIELAKQPVQIVTGGNVQQTDTDDADYLATQIGILQSRSLAERVARQLNIASDPSVIDQSMPRPDRERQAIRLVQSGFAAEPVRYSRLIKLSFTSRSPRTASRVANGYSDNYIASNLERQYETTAYARQFLEQRLAVVKVKLEESERELFDYARKAGIILVGGNEASDTTGATGSSLVSASLVSANAALAAAQNDRIAAEQRYRQAQAKGSTMQSLDNPVISQLRQQRADLQTQYEQNLNIFKADYPQMVQMKSRIDAITEQITSQNSDISTALGGDYATAVARERELSARVEELKSEMLDARGRSINYTILQREVDTNRTLYDGLLQRYKEIGVAGGVGQNLISVIDDARTPGSPVSPNLLLNLGIGLVGGLVLGIGAAFAIEFIDDTIATPEDIEQKLKLSSFGVVPRIAKDASLVAQLADPRSAVAEAYLSIRTVLQFSTERGLPASLLVTSSRAGEGKSSTSLALAANLVRDGKRVLLIDADLRKPTFLAKDGETIGLSSLLTGEDQVERAIHKTSTEGLYVLPSGSIPPNPAELIGGTRMRELLAELMRIFDTVVIDAPPVLGLADAPLLGSLAEATLLVFESGKIRSHIARSSLARLRAANGNVIGAIITKFSDRFGTAGYGYGYGGEAYTYGASERTKMIDLAAPQ